MIGYKIFNPDWTCKDFKYEVGKTYHIDDEIECCRNGFHFCKELVDCFNYYNFDYNNKFAIVEANDKIITEDEEKYCTNNITIKKELSFEEVCNILNYPCKLIKLAIDTYYITKGWFCVLFGGRWGSGLYAGPFYWHVNRGSSYLSRDDRRAPN